MKALGQCANLSQTGTDFATARTVAWGYDPLGQVTNADSSTAAQDRAYEFDLIGNRLSGSDLGSPISYTPNALNQYTTIGALNPVHDADGNMTSGPLPANVNANSTLVWDGENRLIQAQVNGGSTVSYLYDSQSRRIATISSAVTTLTIYDGRNPIAEYWSVGFQPASLTKSFTWGIDLSGSIQGAGGVGGLLAVTDSTGTYFPTYDGNGNVSEYLDSTGNVSADYEYDPFGKTTVATGPKANDFAHRFSTKPLDATTGLYYYGYRFYDPNTGRWPSRDPIGERGGINLYGMVENNAISRADLLGLIVHAQFVKCKQKPNLGLLTVLDVGDGKKNDSGEYEIKRAITGLQFYSGTNPDSSIVNVGVIPDGLYMILYSPRDGFYRLEPMDRSFGDDKDDKTRRGEFRLHRPGASLGCVTCGANEGDRNDQMANSEWSKADEIIDQTEIYKTEVNNKSRNPIAPDKEEIKVYGFLEVSTGEMTDKELIETAEMMRTLRKKATNAK